MCGRFTLTTRDFRQLAAALDAEDADDSFALYRPRYNIAPTDPHWIVREKQERRELLPATWGLVNSWAPDAKGAARQINCRAETALRRPAFRDAFVRRRCVVPADGFFEWTGSQQARRPLWFHEPHGDLLLFAGLYETWTDPADGARRRTFTIITTGANALMAPVHDRMPVVLRPDDVPDWLHVPAEAADDYAARLEPLLRPPPEDLLVATPVSARVNSVKNDDEDCLAPAGDEPVVAPRLL